MCNLAAWLAKLTPHAWVQVQADLGAPTKWEPPAQAIRQKHGQPGL